jgi:hypothetical protein
MNTCKKMSLVLALGLGFSAAANSSTTLYDNLSSPVSGEQGIPPGWIADAFTTGTNSAGYNLGNITLKLSGGIDGSINGIVLQLFSDPGSGVPGTTAIGHAYVDPLLVTSTPNNNVFTPNALDASLVLSPNTTYWARIDALAPGAANVNWSYASSGPGLWAFDTLGVGPFDKLNGDTGPFLMKVVANPILSSVPVPAAAWLMGSGLIGLASSWRRKKAG